MTDIYVAIRNQDGVALPSVDGELLVVLIARDNQFRSQRPVTLRTAVAVFSDLPPGFYTVLVRHSNMTPTEARYDAELTEKTLLGLRFIYNEVERRLSTIESEINSLP
jgi:hypothetical protein